MRGERQTSLKGIKDRNGDIIWHDELIMKKWREYFQNLPEGRNVELNEIQRRFGSKTTTSVKKNFKKPSTKSNWAKQQKEKRIPKDCEVAVIVPIYKKEDNRECGNHRGISLLSIPSKVYSRVLETRIRYWSIASSERNDMVLEHNEACKISSSQCDK
ncbi:uncharacterized protein [Halyomorpha halys]|uniref:uncharacterized protein n=1 Tax=Halyomorpha halys TaxID=286706 RepID=UPI0034D24814